MRRCRACQGFVPASKTCPNCAADADSAAGWLKGVAAFAGSAALGVSLTACGGGATYEDLVDPGPWQAAAYGAPPVNPEPNLLLDSNALQAIYADSLRTAHHHGETKGGGRHRRQGQPQTAPAHLATAVLEARTEPPHIPTG